MTRESDRRMTYRAEKAEGKRHLERKDDEEDDVVQKVPKHLGDQVDTELSLGGIFKSVSGQSSNQGHAGIDSDSSSLIADIGLDNVISCFVRLSRANYGSIALLNRSFRSLVRSGELYKLRQKRGVVEHWVYFSCMLNEWEVFDPIRRHWMHLPSISYNNVFVFSDKESLAVGTELLVFGRNLMSYVIYRYSLLTNAWTTGMQMNKPRCLFGSASLGEIAILAGGSDSNANPLNYAELYNSDTGRWTMLPSMKKARKSCSAVFMDGKFYVIGGTGAGLTHLSCGEVYDLKNGTWTEILNISPIQEAPSTVVSEAPPLIAVVKNELYAADYAVREVKKYNKEGEVWITLGKFPERAGSTRGWGIAFKACGDRLIFVGGPHVLNGNLIEVYSWVPGEGPLQWDVLGRKEADGFVYNCAVMGC
ncbi:hypothetical protein SASPL_141388 [Salvia splendens]|uniref:Uncharacterized protein n=2 Tax=Salvia splendens TaxID=180675 RepID=A0A8X8WTJ0_SALSN|nr:hypothetical protein SASPL_141388 [Salvia splendens]